MEIQVRFSGFSFSDGVLIKFEGVVADFEIERREREREREREERREEKRERNDKV